VNFVHAAAEAVRDLLLEFNLDLAIGEQPELYNTALVVLSAPFCGPNANNLAAFTGLPSSFIVPIRRRMIQAELWTDTDVHCDGWFERNGVLSLQCFWLDVMVARGLVLRIWNEEVDQYCYGYNADYSVWVN
jgi:hypothetical protein